MADMNLAKLKKVDLRVAWNHEARDFTTWLAETDNLRLLGDEIGFDIQHIKTEAEVGNFSVDILAEEEGTGRKIVIENQLEQTNHDHLGKILTYASGYDAEVIVWIVRDAREEHRRAIDWLNEHTDESIEFYLVKIELWQIEDSPIAPRFEIVSKPNDWAKTVKESAGNADLTETKIKQLEFWNGMKEYAKQSGSKLRFHKSNPQHWMNMSIGSSDAHVSLTVRSKEGFFGVELYIPDNKELYTKLFEHKSKIEAELGQQVEWMALPDKKASRLRVSYPGDFADEDKWNLYFGWMLGVAENFKKVLPKYL